jgi:hypothetical protein
MKRIWDIDRIYRWRKINYGMLLAVWLKEQADIGKIKPSALPNFQKGLVRR